MESIIRFFFLDDISPTTNESDPKRMGARIIAFLVNKGSSPLRSMIFIINNRMALDPTSIAAYFFIFNRVCFCSGYTNLFGFCVFPNWIFYMCWDLFRLANVPLRYRPK